MRTMSGSPCLHYDCHNRNIFGYCNTTVCINERYQQEQWGVPSTTNKSENVVIKQQTNADHLRAETNDTLALFMASVSGCPYHPDAAHITCEKWDYSCVKCWRDWLKQEVG